MAGKKIEEVKVEEIKPVLPQSERNESGGTTTFRRVHCEACAQNYMLEIGKTPVCCEKPTIKDL